ncbi:MAG: hypothetical protein WEC75_13705 [Dehalococcoidia bacterium]
MKRWIIVATVVLGFAVGACGSDTESVPRAGPDMVAAPIDDLELIIRESFPPQYAARVVSGIPDGCHSFDAVKMERSGEVFEIVVTNLRGGGEDAVCTQIYGTHEEIVELGSDLTAGTTYTVRANDRELTFIAE